MTYQSMLATRLLRSRCLVCGLKLLDSKSLEIGIGPVCRQRLDYDRAACRIDGPKRQEANDIIHALVEGTDDPQLDCRVARLRELGFRALADLVLRRLVVIRIEYLTLPDGVYLDVQTPYSANALAAWRAIPDRFWNPPTKTNRIPIEQEVALHALLTEHYGGLVGRDANGMAFRVPCASRPFDFPNDRRDSNNPELRMLNNLRRIDRST